MEAATAWEDGPGQFQLANWRVGERVAAGLPVEYASIDIPDACAGGLEVEAYEEYDDDVELQLQQQLVEYYAAASRRHSFPTSEEAKISTDGGARSVAEQVVGEFEKGMSKRMMRGKMHRYPACLGAVGELSYTTPRIVAIGPYHHGLEHLKPAEKVKHVAACHCIKGVPQLREVYQKFADVADDARSFYDKDVMSGIGCDDFRHMMFFDACFLVQYMAMRNSNSRRDIIDKRLQRFMRPNRSDIFHDVMLLENQIPWTVVEAVLSFVRALPDDVQVQSIPKEFVRRSRGCMMPDDREPPQEDKWWVHDYRPPHLLGLLRYFIVGGRGEDLDREAKNTPGFSVSAMDLAEIGITLKANKTMRIIDMYLNQKGAVFTELCLAPLSLNRDRASYLFNMAALELCTTESFSVVSHEDSAVCSYVMVLANLLCREEEVQELRERGLLQRGGGLSNEEALRFFTSFQGLRFGRRYYHIMQDIENYRNKSWIKTKLHAFIHNHKKTIAAVVTGIGAVGGIIATLLSIKQSI